MAANCGNCGTSVEPEGSGLRARADTHLHYSGNCHECGLTVQWHRTVIGLDGMTALLGPPRACPARCGHHNPDASPPSRG